VSAIGRRGDAALAAALALAATTLTVLAVRAERRPAAAAPAPPAWSARPGADDPHRKTRPPALPRSVPVRLDIPAAGVHTGLLRLGLAAGGSVDVPPLARDAPAGWYERSPSPGEAGAALILGHGDAARDGPGVFHRLGDLRPGDAVVVRRADGGTVRFTVVGVASYPRSAVPAGTVAGPFGHAGLRLITCGGSSGPARRGYRGNVIVFAVAR
jgi:hypothetical protein